MAFVVSVELGTTRQAVRGREDVVLEIGLDLAEHRVVLLQTRCTSDSPEGDSG